MAKLRCNEKECKHNCYKVCNKQAIVLDDDAVCCSFQRRSIKDNYFGYEFGSEMAPAFSDAETGVNCNCQSCFYNHECRCKASDVKIDNEAWCETYRKK